jgi:hypothetical protein
VPTPSRASAWVLASSLLLLFPAAAGAQAQSDERTDAPAPAAPRDTRLETRRSGVGRDQFIAPVMGIQIEGDGLNLPAGISEDDPPAKPAAEGKGQETKKEESRSTPQ